MKSSKHNHFINNYLMINTIGHIKLVISDLLKYHKRDGNTYTFIPELYGIVINIDHRDMLYNLFT